MASLVGEQQISSNSQTAEPVQKVESRESSVERKAKFALNQLCAPIANSNNSMENASAKATLHWFAQVGGEDCDTQVSKDRDEKLKLARERQNEERQRKIEELKAQAEAAQRYREQKEEERRRRIEEIRQRDTEKRHQVEERKRAITEAEKERREYILRKNQERDSKLESKKRERNSVAFAFGSSTPRLLEPDFGLVSPSTFLGHRRSTSITNVTGASLSRRSSERELTDSGAKKRATSAGGTDRHDDDIVDSTSHIVFRSVARRKTDLMPTIPSPRDGHYGSRSSLSHTPRTPGSRSGNVTPGGSISTSRPGSAMSTSTNMSTTGLIARRSMPATRKPRPASIAGTGVSLDEINKHRKDNKPPAKVSTPSSTTTSAQNTPKRTSNMMSTSMIVTSSRLSSAEKKTPAKREPPTPKVATPKSLSKTPSSDRLNKSSKDANASMSKSMIAPSPSISANNATKIEKDKTTAEQLDAVVKSKEEKDILNLTKTEAADRLVDVPSDMPPTMGAANPDTIIATENETVEPALQEVAPSTTIVANEELKIEIAAEANAEREQPQSQLSSHNGSKENSEVRELTPPGQAGQDGNDMMTASMIARNKITTEEEAKAALAERRRLAREEAERQAELERQRIEAERLAELKRQEEEAERQRQFEEEANRLAQEQRKAEEERLRQAIEEAKQRDEEERRKREDEERQRVQREEAEKKAKEEAEKQRLEVAERLKREEKEREERRKRVEAIMSRTRKGGGNAATPNSTPVKENSSPKTTPDNVQQTPQSAHEQQEEQQQQQHQEQISVPVAINASSDSGSTSGSTTTATTPNPLITQVTEPQNSQAMYEQSVIDKETALINSFSNMIIDENVKNLQQQFQHHQQQPTQILDISNGKISLNDELLQNTTTAAVANGNGHIENINNKNDINILQDAVATATTNQLIDLSIESQDINNAVNFNNNNSLLTTTTTTLVTADSHENKDISLL